MRIRVSHTTTYHYETPPSSVTQTVRLTPRSDGNQYIVDWRIELSEDCQLTQIDDAFGNISHTFTAISPPRELRIHVEGLVDTQDNNGVLRNIVERFPPSLFLRTTPLTQPSDTIVAFSEQCRAETGNEGTLALLHNLMGTLHRNITFDTDPTKATTTAQEAFALQRGVCQDLAHIFIACARTLHVPSRYVSGYFHRDDGVTAQEAGHAWAEAYVENLGWVGFDPANGICVSDAYVRVAIGLDYLGAAPVRGARYGGSGESLNVAIQVAQARQQIQN